MRTIDRFGIAALVLLGSGLWALSQDINNPQTNASALTSGTLPTGRLTGSYTGITGTGTLAAGATGAGFTLALAAPTVTGTLSYLNAGTGSLPAFNANKNNVDQTGVVSATQTVLTFGTEVYDVGNFFAADAWTPPAGKVNMIAGYYSTGIIATGALCIIYITKNAVSIASAIAPAASVNTCTGTVVTDAVANGSDVFKVAVYITTSSGTATIDGQILNTYFMGHYLSP